MLSIGEINLFQQTLTDFYRDNQRDLPWRIPGKNGVYDPYMVLVSELMLQQTQVLRVIPKFNTFLERFPNISTLADSSLEEVYSYWQGLGYNRRARFLLESARQIHGLHRDSVPECVDELIKLPGIGYNTACAIAVYSFNQPHVFIETNVRTVYLHHFFPGVEDVHDTQLKPLIEQTMDIKNPREFYWALMDYGTYLKKVYGNANVRSRHYTKQPKFEGSLRQMRGNILRMLMDGPVSLIDLRQAIDDDRLDTVVEGLIRDQLIQKNGKVLQIAD